MTTNENEVTTPRSVATLLALDTYQGMTDDEIQSLIDYYVATTEANTRATTMNDITSQNIATVATNAQTVAQAQAAMLQSIIDRATNLQLQGVQHG